MKDNCLYTLVVKVSVAYGLGIKVEGFGSVCGQVYMQPEQQT